MDAIGSVDGMDSPVKPGNDEEGSASSACG